MKKSLTKLCALYFGLLFSSLSQAEYQNPTETDFYKYATGQDSDFEAREAERQKQESLVMYLRAFQKLREEADSEQIDVSDFTEKWKINEARAQIKYGKPHYFLGELERVEVVGREVRMIFKSKDGKGITVYPYFIQAVFADVDGTKQIVDTVSDIDFAASFDSGENFRMLCDRAYPNNIEACLMFAERDIQ
ncbi:MAG: hypothetical protein KKB56_17610 [Gammaproteobacteria bacterium]|nr:hypothetical protein [Alphaproteobacteria bacterium]MBU1774998.1 hypothetical protein [Gammaproteobacteria bacterium]